VEYLLTVQGILPLERNGAGWSPLQEALASGVGGLVEVVYRATQEYVLGEYRRRLAKIGKALKEVPDFYMEVQWGLGSWIPFVSRFCPSDRYKIWKIGSKLRLDSTLIGFENMQWVRGDISIIFNGDNKSDYDKSFYVIDHHQKIAEPTISSMLSSSGDSKQLRKEIEELMKQELIYTETCSLPKTSDESETSNDGTNVKIGFKPCVTWTGAVKTSMEAGYSCTLYELEGLTMSIQHRTIKDHVEGQPIDHSVGDDLRLSFVDYIKEEKGKVRALLYQNEILVPKQKTFKGTVYLSPDFPIKTTHVLSILEAVLPTSSHMEQIHEVVKCVPDNQFPMKIEIPIFPTVTATVTLEKYSPLKDTDEDMFSVPSDYTTIQG